MEDYVKWNEYSKWCLDVIRIAARAKQKPESEIINNELIRLREKIYRISRAVDTLVLSKVGCDGLLNVPVDRYNNLVEIINQQDE